MTKEEIKSILNKLEDHEKRLTQIEGIKYVKTKKEQAMVTKKDKVVSKKKPGSTKPVLELIDREFFKTSKDVAEVQAILKKKAFTFTNDELAMTLMRFVRKGQLERDGDGGKQNPWKYKLV